MCRVFILHNHITLYVFVAVYIVLGIYMYWGEGPEIIDQLSVYTDHSVDDKIVSGIFILINSSKVEKCAQSES